MKTLTLGITSIGLAFLLASQASYSDSDEGQTASFWQRSSAIAPVSNPLYEGECGGCHFAYPPGLLPARSWQAIMAGLANHFGDNAELSANNHQAIAQYLADNSADKAASRRSRKLIQSLPDNTTPLRITELPACKREHRGVPARVFNNNPKLSSLSQCAACHGDAKQGMFSERQISIPGYGRWDD
jgi:hypothetical protein